MDGETLPSVSVLMRSVPPAHLHQLAESRQPALPPAAVPGRRARLAACLDRLVEKSENAGAARQVGGQIAGGGNEGGRVIADGGRQTRRERLECESLGQQIAAAVQFQGHPRQNHGKQPFRLRAALRFRPMAGKGGKITGEVLDLPGERCLAVLQSGQATLQNGRARGRAGRRLTCRWLRAGRNRRGAFWPGIDGFCGQGTPVIAGQRIGEPAADPLTLPPGQRQKTGDDENPDDQAKRRTAIAPLFRDHFRLQQILVVVTGGHGCLLCSGMRPR